MDTVFETSLLVMAKSENVHAMKTGVVSGVPGSGRGLTISRIFLEIKLPLIILKHKNNHCHHNPKIII